MKVRMHQPRRVLEIPGRRSVAQIFAELGLDPDAHLVIRGEALLTSDSEVGEEDEIEIRPVISGGAPDGASCAA